jgi:hypothetical protein
VAVSGTAASEPRDAFQIAGALIESLAPTDEKVGRVRRNIPPEQ